MSLKWRKSCFWRKRVRERDWIIFIFLAVWASIPFETSDLTCLEIEKPGFYQFAVWQKQKWKIMFYLNLSEYYLRTCYSNFNNLFRQGSSLSIQKGWNILIGISMVETMLHVGRTILIKKNMKIKKMFSSVTGRAKASPIFAVQASHVLCCVVLYSYCTRFLLVLSLVLLVLCCVFSCCTRVVSYCFSCSFQD